MCVAVMLTKHVSDVDLEWHDDLLPTGSTLLIAPSHLTSQWKNEAEKCMPGLRVIIITTKPQFDKVHV
jgi:SNF2 family DNA or RNA helicase